ncbi:MAG: hypothetical protein A3A43_02775 [Candidatus Liptonbacteria bacterium RIFCSPLOWO2_01_FULL_56_20]|uniref:ASCH domain-containing protein n=1 Tax=Candidatus Liptonbacteria bacterium RIFCSPLOWO2_01_FULL_56_20 TaxID=1798652 RepID=A0A1G2CK31_9BACT|nr:MAG: hypothetical protein UY96_C0009G0019 [Parcubacteria group bacterium GW2011_GWB1_56_8]OGY97562.1 MAG: hypothetical protein A2681_00700 [Candidatus Liptonbacteria bacterium RIFCSPHIGHO2_01_FULL_56_18b]OGZ00778.1 MAG: hypothetical protein A3A43_02775 [Candidatus Liptonbacteria bacterium RIFCSPLOWO2_01_FULL_56_20]
MPNKAYTLRFSKVNRDSWNAIRLGAKKIETRAATVRYREIRAGDTLAFVCGRTRFKKRARRVRIFPTVASLLRTYRVTDINPYLSSAKELRAKYDSFSKYREKIRRHGLIAIELKE